jgi:hypothetical protein
MPSRSRSSDSNVGSGPKRASVQFAETLVTGVSRPISNSEHWTLYNFERHARKCNTCLSPYCVYKENRQLCLTGHDLAIDVAILLFKLGSDGMVYYKSKSEHQEIRIEIPVDYQNVIGLLKAIKRSGNGFLKTPKSYDRTYLVQPLILSKQLLPNEYHHRNNSTNFWSSQEEEPTGSRERQSRGSLYDDDQHLRNHNMFHAEGGFHGCVPIRHACQSLMPTE